MSIYPLSAIHSPLLTTSASSLHADSKCQWYLPGPILHHPIAILLFSWLGFVGCGLVPAQPHWKAAPCRRTRGWTCLWLWAGKQLATGMGNCWGMCSFDVPALCGSEAPRGHICMAEVQNCCDVLCCSQLLRAAELGREGVRGDLPRQEESPAHHITPLVSGNPPGQQQWGPMWDPADFHGVGRSKVPLWLREGKSKCWPTWCSHFGMKWVLLEAVQISHLWQLGSNPRQQVKVCNSTAMPGGVCVAPQSPAYCEAWLCGWSFLFQVCF